VRTGHAPALTPSAVAQLAKTVLCLFKPCSAYQKIISVHMSGNLPLPHKTMLAGKQYVVAYGMVTFFIANAVSSCIIIALGLRGTPLTPSKRAPLVTYMYFDIAK
jgi:hypothetical protein